MEFFLRLRVRVLFLLVKAVAPFFGISEFPPIPSVSAVIKKGNKFLLIKPTYKRGLVLPGGVIKEGETPAQALVREVKEETGFDIKVGRLLGIYPFQKTLAGLNFCYQAFIVAGKLKASAEGEPVWLTPGQALKKLGSIDRRIIKEHGR